MCIRDRHKMEPISLEERTQVKIGRDQILTLIGFLTFIVCNLFLKIDMMITPICAGVVLLCLGCGEPDKVVRGIPWSTLIMIGGMTVYVGVISGFGGVELISRGIAAVANRTVAPAIMTTICGIMSLFSSGNGVVIPTMSATISSLAESIPGLNIATMFWAVVIGANATAISPMSTVGANSIDVYKRQAEAHPAETNPARILPVESLPGTAFPAPVPPVPSLPGSNALLRLPLIFPFPRPTLRQLHSVKRRPLPPPDNPLGYCPGFPGKAWTIPQRIVRRRQRPPLYRMKLSECRARKWKNQGKPQKRI